MAFDQTHSPKASVLWSYQWGFKGNIFYNKKGHLWAEIQKCSGENKK